MKKFVFYPGCVMQTEQYALDLSLREILPKFDVELVDVQGFSCCGEPLKSVNQMLSVSLAARNIALAEREGLDMFVPCPMCHLAMSECKRILDSDEEMKQRVNTFLKDDALTYTGKATLVSILDMFHEVIGLEKMKKKVTQPLDSLKVASHYGCHLIRPSEIGRPDDAENPQKMEQILSTIGAKPEDYPEKLDCCGALLNANLPETALTKTGQKLQKIEEYGFNALVDVCPWCHRQFDARQKKAGETVAAKLNVPVVYLTQLIGLSIGISEERLGLNLNLSPVEALQNGGN
ncbi:MAG: CoB--CoM heterodisulfide reductase iron-sulfur subunit B family protein [Candidatus Thermoplasmatota archaeon]|nr:CoB--CoM heterodisulfide reductase iron-sulfur subunit B family protein [Candidatus Thermoplasmatota archaeon]